MNRHIHRAITLSTLALLAGRAQAQSFNVDLNVAAGAGAGGPSSAFGAAAAQPGYWNAVSSAGTAGIFNLDGSNSSTSFTAPGGAAFSGTADAGATGDVAKLLLDYQSLPGLGTLQYSFNNLAAGTYAVFTYAPLPNSDTNQCGVTVTGTTSAYQYVGGDLVSNKLTPGITHSVHIVTVGAGGVVTIKVSDSPSGTAHVSGFQIRKIDSNRLRFYVDDTAVGASDGTGWATAYTDLQVALKAAADIGGANAEIWTAQGFYYPTSGTDRTATFTIPSGLHLYGGFAGTETSLTQRTYPWLHITAMTGSIGTGADTDNSYHVVTANNTSSGTLIDGFSIAHGYANGSGDDATGGGMIAKNSSIVLRNVKFLSNYAGVEGGAMLSTGGNPAIVKGYAYNNSTSGSGGAFYHHTSGALQAYNTTFLQNTAVGDGGAAKLLFAPGVFVNCLFNGNSSSSGNGGALAIGGDASDTLTVEMSTIVNGHAGLTCGGVYAGSGAKLDVSNSILWANSDSIPDTVIDEQVKAVTAQGSVLTSSYNTIQGIDSDPMFVDINGPDNIPGNNDDKLWLAPGSPCIDSGDNNHVPLDGWDLDEDGITFEFTPIDLNGDPRFVDDPTVPNTGNNFGAIDRGCYEHQFVYCPADFDHNGYVNGEDMDAFMVAFQAGDPAADFDQNGYVNGEDADAFGIAFYGGC